MNDNNTEEETNVSTCKTSLIRRKTYSFHLNGFFKENKRMPFEFQII